MLRRVDRKCSFLKVPRCRPSIRAWITTETNQLARLPDPQHGAEEEHKSLILENAKERIQRWLGKLPGGQTYARTEDRTGTAFSKPVDRVVGHAIAAWEKVRPQGMKLPDPKIGEMVDFLFLFRLTVIGKTYLNKVLIPVLCKKAGVPAADVRGNITSHRARSTIASQLFNAKEQSASGPNFAARMTGRQGSAR